MSGLHSAMPNLYVVGFMGTGKSSISRRVARKLGMKFLDTDEKKQRRLVHLPIVDAM